MKRDLKAKLFRGLADPSRFRVLDVLRHGPRCVSDLIEATRLAQSNLSMHLACLLECGLVRASRNGKFVHYELADKSVGQLLRAADRVLARVGEMVDACPRYENRVGIRRNQKTQRR